MQMFRRKIMGYQEGLKYREAFVALIARRGLPAGVGLFCDLDASSLGTNWVMILTPSTPIAFEELSSDGWEAVERGGVTSWMDLASAPHTAEHLGIELDGWMVKLDGEDCRRGRK